MPASATRHATKRYELDDPPMPWLTSWFQPVGVVGALFRPLTDTRSNTSPDCVPVGYGTLIDVPVEETSDPAARYDKRGTKNGTLEVLRGNDHGVEPGISM
ncbi:MAG: hypothetical protein EBY80_01605 [Actinobacteria bacterium]|nr:hypothetical protein [Actinomycetota bacterium]